MDSTEIRETFYRRVFQILLPALISFIPLVVAGVYFHNEFQTLQTEAEERWFSETDCLANHLKEFSTFDFWCEEFSNNISNVFQRTAGKGAKSEDAFLEAIKQTKFKEMPSPKVWGISFSGGNLES